MHSATTEDEQTKVDGVELHTVAIMGIVESVEEHSTNVNFKINDGTGVVEGKLWNDKDSSGGLGLKIANCRYCRSHKQEYRVSMLDNVR